MKKQSMCRTPGDNEVDRYKIQEEAKAVLGKVQEEIKKYANKKRAEVVRCKRTSRIMLSEF